MSGDRAHPRLLIIARGAEDYGVASELLAIAAGLHARGWSMTLYALGEGRFAEEMAACSGAAIVLDPHVPRRFVKERGGVLLPYARSVAGSVRFVAGLRTHLARHRYDAVVFCEPGLVLPIAAAVTGRRVPCFWLMPNTVNARYPGDINRRLYAAAFAASGMVPVANSRFTRSTLGRAGTRAECVELGADPARFAGPAAPDPLARIVPAGAIRLLVMARLVPFKGQAELLDAMLSDRAFDGVHLILCGGPAGTPYEAALRRRADRSGAGDRLHVLGPTDEPAAFLHAADVVASMRTTPEPFGLAIVEAMLTGRPVLAHAAGGPRDIVVDGVTGWLLPDMAPATIADGLARMLGDRSRWTAMGAAGRVRALERYTVATMTDRLLAMFARHGVGADAERPAEAGAVAATA